MVDILQVKVSMWMVVRVCNKHIYVASCATDGGIYHYIQLNGVLVVDSYTPADRPMYMIIDKSKMYVLLRAPFDNGESGVITYDIDANGRLVNPSEIISTKGEAACHIAVHNEKVYCANYISGSVIQLPDRLVQHKGRGNHSKRQTSPHAHYVGATPDGNYICVADLGLDTIFIYNLDMSLYSCAHVPCGHGVRHLAFSPDGQYLFAVNELGSTVVAFGYNDGQLNFMDIHSCLSNVQYSQSTASAIRVTDELIYTSNRGHDSISILQFINNKLMLLDCVSCGGKTPRDFIVFESYLLIANQDSDNVTVLDIKDDYSILENIAVKTPVCICAR